MKVTIDLEEGERPGRGLCYWLLVRAGAKSLPLQQPSQWFYEIGKALYELTDSEITEALESLRDHQTVTVSPRKPESQL